MKKNILFINAIWFLFLSSTCFAQGWINITPQGITRPYHYKALDFQDGSYEIYVWEDTAGFKTNNTHQWTSFLAFYAYTCSPFERAERRLSDFDKPYTSKNRLVSYFLETGCMVECWGLVYQDTNGVISHQCMRKDFDDFLCQGSNASVAFSPIDSNDVYVAFFDSIYYSSDGGYTFISKSSPDTIDYSPNLTSLVINPHNTNTLFAAGFSDNEYRLYQSTDAGYHWYTRATLGKINQIKFHPTNPDIMFVASDSGIYRTTDSGNNWNLSISGQYHAIEIIKGNTNTIFAGNLTGDLYRSTDAGLNWALYNNSFANLAINGIFSRLDNDTLIVSSLDGIFKVYASYIVGINDRIKFEPKTLELFQNYPNPFNPITTIEYSISTPSFVTIIIYNIVGQEVKKLVDERKERGIHKITWDGKDKLGNQVSSGLYFYKLHVGNFSKTKKLMFLK